ncbi:hypothetical protein FRAHR75_50067 [Frankia sp. Hr75.2]|nr:hypothetical protein FRAHR75_50067 [Frankia sp. Hr75.2]SQD94727.1 hypothetical protein FMEAI12_2740005 [Parafrankia sp. Ea1.12]
MTCDTPGIGHRRPGPEPDPPRPEAPLIVPAEGYMMGLPKRSFQVA